MGRRAKLSEPNQIQVPDVSNQHTVISMERRCVRNVLQLQHSGAGLSSHGADFTSSDAKIPFGVKRRPFMEAERFQ